MVVPVHNEERSIGLLHEEPRPPSTHRRGVGGRLRGRRVDGRIVSALTRLHAREDNVRVVRLRRNFGKAAALSAGFAQAAGERVVTIDGDLQDDPAEIPRSSRNRGGLRRRLGMEDAAPRPARTSSPVEALQRRRGLDVGRPSARHELRPQGVPRARSCTKLVLYGELHRFIPVLAHEQGYRVAELPVNHRPREHGRSRYGMERYLRGFLDLLTVSFMGVTGTGRYTYSAGSASCSEDRVWFSSSI